MLKIWPLPRSGHHSLHYHYQSQHHVFKIECGLRGSQGDHKVKSCPALLLPPIRDNNHYWIHSELNFQNNATVCHWGGTFCRTQDWGSIKSAVWIYSITILYMQRLYPVDCFSDKLVRNYQKTLDLFYFCPNGCTPEIVDYYVRGPSTVCMHLCAFFCWLSFLH